MSEQDKAKIAALQDDHDPDISALYRQSAQELPPAALDDQILRAAHAAVTTQEAASITPKPRRPWPLLGGLAASVLVAVLAVKLLPYSIRSLSPEMKERAARDQPIDGLAPKSAAPMPSIDSGTVQATPEALPEKRMPKDEDSLSRAQPPFRSEAFEADRPALQDNRGSDQSDVAILPTDEADTDTSVLRDEEFSKIAALWKSGYIEEAIKRFASFQKRFSDYTPTPHDEAVFQLLQSEVRNQPLPQEKDGD